MKNVEFQQILAPPIENQQKCPPGAPKNEPKLTRVASKSLLFCSEILISFGDRFWLRFGSLLGASWGPLGPLECLLGVPGCLLGASWVSLRASWVSLGVSWGLSGVSWMPLGASWVPLGSSWVSLGASWVSVGFSGGSLGASWVLLGYPLGSCTLFFCLNSIFITVCKLKNLSS